MNKELKPCPFCGEKTEDAKDREIENLKAALKRIAYYRDLNPDMKATEFAVDIESELRNFYCKMGDIAKMALKEVEK